MSTTSTVTALAEIDPTLGDDSVIANYICIQVATWGNGMLLDSTSYGQEDAIELCIGLGQEYPEGVLQFLDIKMVLAFSSSSNMMATSCCFAVAMNWCGEPVKLHMWPLMTTQVRDYIAAWSSHPSSTQAPVMGEGVEAWPLPSEPYLDNGPQMDLTTRNLWDLDDDQLWEALEAVLLETAR